MINPFLFSYKFHCKTNILRLIIIYTNTSYLPSCRDFTDINNVKIVNFMPSKSIIVTYL